MVFLKGAWKTAGLVSAGLASAAHISFGTFDLGQMMSPILGFEIAGVTAAAVFGGYGALAIINELMK